MRTIAIVTLTFVSVSTSPWTNAWANGAKQELAAENFAEADANADGALTFEEFSMLIDLNAQDNLGRAAMIKRMGRQSMAFGRIDADANGLLTTEEISAIAARDN